MPALPPPQAVQDFRECDFEDPRLQSCFALKSSDVAEDLKEDVLNGVGCFGGIAGHAVSNVVNRRTIGADQFIVSRILIGLQARHKERFLGCQLRRPIQPVIGDFSGHFVAVRTSLYHHVKRHRQK